MSRQAMVIVFPGSNCDQDVAAAFVAATGQQADLVWHTEFSAHQAPLAILPGGFSYGDYLRAGAIAARSPALDALREHHRRGGLVLGICNGFQILTEAGLLPGAFARNHCLHFLSQDVSLRVEANDSPFLAEFSCGEVIDLPIAHAEGAYQPDRSHPAGDGRVALRYCNQDGSVNAAANPNGAIDNVAGLLDQTGRIFGLMPHPERNADPALGSGHGGRLFRSALQAVSHLG
ncbi:MAG: phosphoribosylformylglycinamidine synthase subunit PurQ [Sulfobacillus sp.]